MWRPEGITQGGKGRLSVGSCRRTDHPDQLAHRPDVRAADSAAGKPGVGLDRDESAVNPLFGEVLRTLTVSAGAAYRFINDLVVTGGTVYATDSANQELVVVELPASLSLPPSGPATLLPLPGELARR